LLLRLARITKPAGDYAVSPQDFGPTTAPHSILSRGCAWTEPKTLLTRWQFQMARCASRADLRGRLTCSPLGAAKVPKKQQTKTGSDPCVTCPGQAVRSSLLCASLSHRGVQELRQALPLTGKTDAKKISDLVCFHCPGGCWDHRCSIHQSNSRPVERAHRTTRS
jgi:hypothetical protein